MITNYGILGVTGQKPPKERRRNMSSKEVNSETPTNFQGFSMAVMICSYCYKESWHTRYTYKGWRSHCCNA
jgi:hypothetical protein